MVICLPAAAPPQVSAMAAVALGLMYVGSGNGEVIEALLQVSALPHLRPGHTLHGIGLVSTFNIKMICWRCLLLGQTELLCACRAHARTPPTLSLPQPPHPHPLNAGHDAAGGGRPDAAGGQADVPGAGAAVPGAPGRGGGHCGGGWVGCVLLWF